MQIMCKCAHCLAWRRLPSGLPAAAATAALLNGLPTSGTALVLPPQIAVFLIPVVVLVGWAMDKPFTLDFDSFAVSCFVLLPSFFSLQVAAVHPCL